MQSKRRQQEKRQLLRPPSTNRYGRRQVCWESSCGSAFLDCKPRRIGFFLGAADGKALRTARAFVKPCHAVARLCRLEMEYALMQCSLGSRSGTSGDDVCGASRSWTGDAIPLALAGARAPTSVCRPRHTGHQSFFASQLEQRSSPTSPRMGSETLVC
jgi:hypothetical protein